MLVTGAPSPISGAVPHSVTRDDVYNGQKIPKGATVMMNVGRVKSHLDCNGL